VKTNLLYTGKFMVYQIQKRRAVRAIPWRKTNGTGLIGRMGKKT
jgi:hypothetical protein